MDEKIQNLLKKLDEIQSLKADFAKMQEDAIENPEEVLEKLGYNVDEFKNLNTEELQEKLKGFQSISEGLLEQAEKLQGAILNEQNNDSKSIENYYKKIQAQGGRMTLQDVDKMTGFFSKYIKSETEISGQSCFHYDSFNCDQTIIDAHSLQKNGPLKVISSNKHEVTFIQKDELNGSRIPKRIKTVNASTFKGFCHEHDAIFQQTIESESYDKSNKHNFLHSYRSFAYSHHLIKQHQDYVTSLIENIQVNTSDIVSSLSELLETIGGNSKSPMPTVDSLNLDNEKKKVLSTTRYESYKKSINESLRKGNYSDLDYLIYSVNHVVPVACSSWIKSHLRFGEGLLTQHDGGIYHGYPIMVTLIPESKGQTHLILARFKSDSISKLLFEQLNTIRYKDLNLFGLTLSSMILRYVENLYISPEWWNSLDSYLKDQFIGEMNLWESNFMKLKPSSNVINLFNQVYKLSNDKT